MANPGVADVTYPGLWAYLTDFISNVLGRIPVRAFFFISGFFFFYKANFTTTAYKNKLQNRVKTLLVPYLSWNLLILGLYFAAQSLPGISGLFSGANKLIADYNFKDFFSVFWNVIEGDKPLVYSLWFMRDLMVVALATPVVYFFVKYTRIFGIIILGALWFFKIWPGIVGFSSVSFFFFSAGAYFSINKLNPVTTFQKAFVPSMIIYPVLAVAELSTRGCGFNGYIHNAAILAGIVFAFNLTSHFVQNGKFGINAFLTSATFFLYAFHEPFTTFLRKFILKFIPVTSFSITLLYFLLPVMVILIALVLYYLLGRYLPGFVAVITGDRIIPSQKPNK